MGGDSGGRSARYRVPVGQAQSEVVIGKSLFVATVGHAPSMDGADAFIARVRWEFSDASHNAWAFKIVGGPQALVGSSDDGEPGGTAGRPMLAVLEGSGLCEVVAVGTRYYGGVKLGVGRLARAYASVVREALRELTTVERVQHRVARIEVAYGWYGRLKHSFPRYEVKIQDEHFSDKITMEIAIPYGHVDEIAVLLREISNGQIDLPRNWLGARYI